MRVWMGVAITGIAVLLVGFMLMSRGGSKEVGQPTPTPKLSGEFTEVRTGGAGDQIVGNYRIYDKDLYEVAKAEGNVILLYFYANWCPTCRIQEPGVVEVFREMSSNDRVVGFRVNTLDSDTTPDGKELANEFGVVYQHTFVVLGEDGQIKKQFTGEWDKEEMRGFLERGGSEE